MNTRRILCLAALQLAIAFAAAPPLRGETRWGTSHPASRTVNAWQFAPASSTLTWSITSNLYRYGTNSGYFYAGVDLPDGALILSIDLEACDVSPSASVTVSLRRSAPAGLVTLATADSGVGETPACGRFFVELPTPEQVDNDLYNYTVVFNTGNDATTTFGSVRVAYQLQVSPAPAVPTFNDVPVSDPAFQYIEALVASGITSGCGGGNFCPNGALTRRQMAVFLSKALGLNWPEPSN